MEKRRHKLTKLLAKREKKLVYNARKLACLATGTVERRKEEQQVESSCFHKNFNGKPTKKSVPAQNAEEARKRKKK